MAKQKSVFLILLQLINYSRYNVLLHKHDVLYLLYNCTKGNTLMYPKEPILIQSANYKVNCEQFRDHLWPSGQRAV